MCECLKTRIECRYFFEIPNYVFILTFSDRVKLEARGKFWTIPLDFSEMINMELLRLNWMEKLWMFQRMDDQKYCLRPADEFFNICLNQNSEHYRV